MSRGTYLRILRKCPFCDEEVFQVFRHIKRKHRRQYDEERERTLQEFRRNKTCLELSRKTLVTNNPDVINEWFRESFGDEECHKRNARLLRVWLVRNIGKRIATITQMMRRSDVKIKHQKSQRERLKKKEHPWFRISPWGVENNWAELLFDQECRKRGLSPLDRAKGWDCPPVATHFEGDCFERHYGLKADRINRKHRIWIEIDEEDHRKTRAYDFARDKFCRKHDWTVIRIFWRRLYNEDYMNRVVLRIEKLTKGILC